MDQAVQGWLDSIKLTFGVGGAIFVGVFSVFYAIALFLLPLFVWSARDWAKRGARAAQSSHDELRRIRQALERAYPPPRSGP